MIFICGCGEILACYSILTPSLVPSPSFFARREACGAVRAGKKKERPGIQRSRMRQFFQFFSEFGYFSGHFSIFTRENIIIIGVAS